MADTRLIERWLSIAAICEESIREGRSMTALPPTYYLHVWLGAATADRAARGGPRFAAAGGRRSRKIPPCAWISWRSACYVAFNIMNRLLSVMRSMTDKSVELSRALQMALFYGECKRWAGVDCAEAMRLVTRHGGAARSRVGS